MSRQVQKDDCEHPSQAKAGGLPPEATDAYFEGASWCSTSRLSQDMPELAEAFPRSSWTVHKLGKKFPRPKKSSPPKAQPRGLALK